jgi:hypothetical protein
VAQLNEDHIMRTPKIRASRLIPVAMLVAASVLGGCTVYSGYPARSYSYTTSYPYGYAYSYNTPAYSYAYPSVYSPDYNSSFNTYATSGGGER